MKWTTQFPYGDKLCERMISADHLHSLQMLGFMPNSSPACGSLVSHCIKKLPLKLRGHALSLYSLVIAQTPRDDVRSMHEATRVLCTAGSAQAA